MNNHLETVARQTLVIVVTVVAIIVVWTQLNTWAIFASFCWGPFVVVAMRNGIRSAPKENWNRDIGPVASIGVNTLLALLIFWPGLLIWCCFGFVFAMTAVWVELVTMCLTLQVTKSS